MENVKPVYERAGVKVFRFPRPSEEGRYDWGVEVRGKLHEAANATEAADIADRAIESLSG